MKKIVCILMLCAAVAACNGYEDAVPESCLVLEGWIDSGGYPVVLLSESIPVRIGDISEEDLVESIARWGKVTVSDGYEEVTLTGMMDERYTPPYVFTTSRMKGVPGRTYTVTADYKDFHATGTTVIPEPVPLDTIYARRLDDSLFCITCGFTDPPQKGDFYTFFTKTKGVDRKYQYSYLAHLSDEVLDGYSEIQLVGAVRFGLKAFSFNFKEGDEVSVKFCTCSRQTYLFWENFDVMQLNNAFVMYEFESDMSGGLEGAVGYWAGYGASYYDIKIF